MDISEALQILGVHPSATPSQIKEAHRDLSKVWHPDRFGSDPKLYAKAEEKLKKINEAYQFLQAGWASHRMPPTSPSSPNDRATSTQSAGPSTQSESEGPQESWRVRPDEAAARAQRIADEVMELERRIATEKDEIRAGWKLFGQAFGIELGIFVAAQLCGSAANNLIGKPGCGGLLLGLVGAVGALAVIVLFIPFWAGLVVVAGIVIRQLANVAIRGARIASLEADIARLNQGKP
jgi:DnaJ-domain-containing protein 1